jgi:hypothetical protein
MPVISAQLSKRFLIITAEKNYTYSDVAHVGFQGLI